ncbi:MAG TPA: hypothetical protein VJN96_17115 [Vicinamibacterales bacterium]|nr:hypothetical protein [Vicinamibacterales bacterium]
MTRRLAVVVFAAGIAGAAGLGLSLRAQPSDSAFFSALRWRLIGPFRAGRVSCVAGVPGDPTTYYIGTPDGGLWKTTDGGVVWKPIFDDVHVPSIGAIAVAPSNPSIVYVGTGHNLLGKGVFKSVDAGATWQRAGLDDSKYIAALLVDPRDPNIVLVGVGSGGNFGTMVYYNNNPHPARGVFRTTDGGRTWTQTLTEGPGASVVDLVRDPSDPGVVFASLSGGRGASGPAIHRSADGGATWTPLEARGFPAGTASANIAVAPGTRSQRLYALGGRGAYRSDDGGANWTLGTNRLASASGHLYVDPTNRDVVYTMGTSMYKSTDAAKTFEAVKGAPGGDDNRSAWIDPQNPRRMIIGADQGPTITVDGGATWTPWYILPNGEHYFVTADDQFPSWIYAAQQDSGTVAIKSRSDFGAIRASDWYPVAGYEQGHIFADPGNPRFVYSHGGGHTVLKFDRETGQVGPIYTPREADRFGPRPGMALSPKDPKRLYVGAQYVLETDDRGVTWRTISQDLTGGSGTIVALAPSPVDAQILWVGASSGLIHLTRDGGTTWKNVSPPDLSSSAATLTLWSMEASSHDAGVAYAAAIDLSDQHAPRLFRTTDFGEHWEAIVQGLAPDVPTRVVREDPQRPNLLYAGTQTGAWVSFDRGDRWQSLQLNLPTVAINDITVHGDDLIIATWGRALWMLDDVLPLRSVDAARAGSTGAFLYPPAVATRVRWNNNQDTPVPPEVPVGQNAPDGAIIDYYLGREASGSLTLSIIDARGRVVREYSNAAPAADTTMPNVPMYWFKPADAERLPATIGMHRVVWDLRFPTPPSLNYGADGEPSSTTSYGIIAPAIIGQSPRQQPIGPLALPGTYTVRLAVNGQTLTRPLTVRNDPRVPTPSADLEATLAWELSLTAGLSASHDAIEVLRDLRRTVADRRTGASANASATAAIQTFDQAAVGAISALAGNRALAQRLAVLEYSDMPVNDNAAAVLTEQCARAAEALGRYRQVVGAELTRLNAALSAGGAAAIPAPSTTIGPGCGR